MTLLYSEVEDALRASVRAVLDKHAAWPAVLARTESGQACDQVLWSILADEVGCAALAVPEESGGGGASWREVAVVAEELGRAAAPVPFLGTTIALALLDRVGEHELLAEVAACARGAVLAVPFGTAPGPVPPAVEVRAGVLHGTVPAVADTSLADVVLVLAGDALYAVDGGVGRDEFVSLDMTRPLADLNFDGVPGRLIAVGGQMPDAVAQALRLGAVVLAAEQLGLAERCLELTVDYLQLRRQFGRVLGSYQALKHRLADLWVAITQMRAVARYAADCAASGSPDLPVAAAVAQAHCSAVVQLHGGIGFTWEHPAHLYLKRAKAGAIGLGTADRHRAALATFADLPGASA